MPESHSKRKIRYERTDDPRIVRVTATRTDGQEIVRLVRVVPMDPEELQDDPLPIEPKPSTNPNIRRWAWVKKVFGPLIALIDYFNWRQRIRQTSAEVCPHPKNYRETVMLEDHTTVVESIGVCGKCLEQHCLEDPRRICVACHGPIIYGSWVNDRRVNGQERYVHHETCSGEMWSASIWRGDHVQIIGHGL